MLSYTLKKMYKSIKPHPAPPIKEKKKSLRYPILFKSIFQQEKMFNQPFLHLPFYTNDW